MLNPQLDFPRYWKVFSETGRVQMQNVLQPDLAEKLHRCLAEEVNWQVALRDEAGVSKAETIDGVDDIDSAAYRDLAHAAAVRARGCYGFLYESYMMVRAHMEGRDQDLLLHRVLEYMNSDAFLQFARTVAGVPGIRRVSAQATRFRAGMFLKNHTDYDAGEGRVVAYVFNLGKGWQADWGGLLQFLDGDDVIVDTFVPRFNSLSLFRVPTRHSVSPVAHWALQPRLGITGWWETLPAAVAARRDA